MNLSGIEKRICNLEADQGDGDIPGWTICQLHYMAAKKPFKQRYFLSEDEAIQSGYFTRRRLDEWRVKARESRRALARQVKKNLAKMRESGWISEGEYRGHIASCKRIYGQEWPGGKDDE